MGGKGSKEEKDVETTAMKKIDPEENHKLEDKRNDSSQSKMSQYGSTAGSEHSEGRVRWKDGSEERFLRRSSTPTCQRPFERQSSRVSTQSGASVRTRTTSVSRSEYHHDLKPDLQTSLSWRLILTAFIIVFGSSFQFGYNIGVLNQPKEQIIAFYNETYTERNGYISENALTIIWSLTTAIFIPGGMIGAFLGGWIADKIGRKKSILFSQLFSLLGAITATCCVVAKAPEMLMLGRVLFGINSGIGNCLAPMFLSEIAPYTYRGAFGTAHQLFITLGIFMASVFGLPHLLSTTVGWPFLFLLEMIPACVSLFVLPFLPESPRYLNITKGDREGAEKALRFYRCTDDISADMEEMDTEHVQKAGPAKPFKITKLFTTAGLRKPLLIACALQVIQQFSGINAIFFYSSGIFDKAGVPKAQIPFAVMGTNAVNVIMTIVSVAIMDKAGRRLLLLIPMLGMIIDLVIITISIVLQTHPGLGWMAYVSVICVIFYVICFAVGLGPIPMMIGAEIFRQGPRPAAMAIAGVVNWVATFVIAISFEIVQEKTDPYTFIIFLILMILFIIFTYFFVPETKNKTFEEIAHAYAPGDDIEVEEAVDEVDDVFDQVPSPNSDDAADANLVTINFENTDENETVLVRKGSKSSKKSAEEVELLPQKSVKS